MTVRKPKPAKRRRPARERQLANLLHAWLHYEWDGTEATAAKFLRLRLLTTALLDTHPACVLSRFPNMRRRKLA